jgi:hypothetical protein
MWLRGSSFGVAIALSLVSASAEDAQNKPDGAAACDHFAWPITREKTWFAGKLPTAHSGERFTMSDEGVLLQLKPTKNFDFFLPPERPPKPDSYSGNIVIFGVMNPGVYQVTLSDEAWIDVFENGFRLKSTAFTGQKDCPDVRKSVRFELTPGAPITIQISNAPKDQVKFAIAPAS